MTKIWDLPFRVLRVVLINFEYASPDNVYCSHISHYAYKIRLVYFNLSCIFLLFIYLSKCLYHKKNFQENTKRFSINSLQQCRSWYYISNFIKKSFFFLFGEKPQFRTPSFINRSFLENIKGFWQVYST